MDTQNSQRKQPTRRSAANAPRRSARSEAGAADESRRSAANVPRRDARSDARLASNSYATVRSVVPNKPKHSGGSGKTVGLIVAVVVLLALIVWGVVSCNSCSSQNGNTSTTQNSSAEASNQQASGSSSNTDADTATHSVSFVAVGDNLPEETLADYAASQATDGGYSYKPIYEYIEPIVQAADVAYVKEEVHLDDEVGVHGYPSFNAPESLADDLVAVGFDVIGSASNHIYDWGYFGACARNREVWNSKNVTFAGSNLNEEEANTIATFESNGITFAFLDYTYGVNGYDESDLEWYEVNFMDEDRITSDVTRAHELADVVIVAMHWGTENYMDIDETQQEYANLLASLNVDLVLGSHPHVIGPVEWLDGTDGHKTLCAYSLGNFLSHHDIPAATNELEGMLSCTFVKEGGSVSIQDATWTPLVNHTDDANGYYRIIPLKDYTNELASQASALSYLDDAVAELREIDREVVGDAIAIDDGQSAAA